MKRITSERQSLHLEAVLCFFSLHACFCSKSHLVNVRIRPLSLKKECVTKQM